MKIKLNTISEAINDFKKGKVLIVVDDENRENEGDFVFPAQIITKEIVNFMIKNGRGLVCVPMTSKRCKKLSLQPMVTKNTEIMDTAFTVSVDLKGHGVTSGISADDRSKTIQALVNPKTKAGELNRPGHVFPLVAKDGGVLRRSGHTEAAVDLARLAGFLPAGVICEIMNEDGSMARLPELMVVAKKFNLKIISIEDLIAYRMKNDTLIQKIGKLNKKIRFVAIINKNGKILKTEMRDEVPSLLKTKNEEKFCQDVTVRRKMREEFDKSLGKVRFVNVERENISQIVMYAKTKSLFVTVEPEISIKDKTKIISQLKKLTSTLK